MLVFPKVFFLIVSIVLKFFEKVTFRIYCLFKVNFQVSLVTKNVSLKCLINVMVYLTSDFSLKNDNVFIASLELVNSY